MPGLALGADGKRLLVAHQVLNSKGTTSRDDVHWGNLITNGLRELALANVLDANADLLRGSRLHRLGDVGRGAGDRGSVAARRRGRGTAGHRCFGTALAARAAGEEDEDERERCSTDRP